MNYRKLIGSNLKQLRKSYGHTQHWLAKRSGVSQPHISKIEHGEASMTMEHLIRIGNTFNHTPDRMTLKLTQLRAE